MHRFRQLVLTLIGTVALLTVITYVIGISQSHRDPMLLLFTKPDGMPCKRACLFGVRPGDTTYDAALVLLNDHPLTRDFEADLKHGPLHGPSARVSLFAATGKPLLAIDLVRTLGPRTTWGTLGSVVAGLSAPDWVSINSDFTVSYHLADHMIFYFSHQAADRIGVDDRLERVTAFAEIPQIPPGAMPWLGFGAIQRYLPGAKAIHLRTEIMIDLLPACYPRSICHTDQ